MKEIKLNQNNTKPLKITENSIKKNELKTLNNVLCMINEEIQVVASTNKKDGNELNGAAVSIKKAAIENIKNLTLSYINMRGN
jgi:hypothetical protein